MKTTLKFSAMNELTFFASLRGLNDLKLRMQFLQHVNVDLKSFSQMELILIVFEAGISRLTEDEAARVAQAILARCGHIIVCRELSFCEKRIILLGDFLHNMINGGITSPLFLACEGIFVKASQCDPREARRLYCADDVYAHDHHLLAADINYEILKEANAAIAEELQALLFSPTRITAWLDQGNRLEDYLY